MSDEPAAEAPADAAKLARATAIYTTWRNGHINNLPVGAFADVERASEHLIAAIAAEL